MGRILVGLTKESNELVTSGSQQQVLEPVGGAWQRDEILYFATPGEEAEYGQGWQDFFESLVGKSI